MSADFDFSDLAPRQCHVTGPDRKGYILREASVDAAVKFRNASAKAGRWDGDKVIGFGDVADSEVVLVVNCLCLTEGDKGEAILFKRNDVPHLIQESTLRSWPIATLTKMFEWVKENSPTLKLERTKEAMEKDRAKLDEEIAKLDDAKLDADHPKA